MFTQQDLNALIKDVTLRAPQTEPFFFVIPLLVMAEEQYAKEISPMCTAAISANRAIFCDTFMESLTPAKRRGLIIHEILHPAFGHLSDPYVDRTLTYSSFKQLANIAQDIVIENVINEMAEAESPNLPAEKRPLSCNHPVDKSLLRFKGFSWRQVYDILREETPSQGEGEGGSGESLDTHIGDGVGEASIANAWKAAQEESVRISENIKQQGNQRGAGEIKIELAKPAVSWKDMLKDYLTSLPAPVRKTWQRVDRRTYGAYRKYAPTLTGHVEALGHVYLLVDTSGSMHEYLATAAADILNLFKVVDVGAVSIVYYDVGIQKQVDLTREDLEDYTIQSMPGGGGTCVNLAFEELSQGNDFDDSAPIVVLTDGYDDYRIGNLKVGPLIWLSYATPVVSDRGLCITIPKD